MTVSYLQWDSNFFGLRIGKVEIYSVDDIENLQSMELELRNQYDLIYIFNYTNKKVDFATLVDIKVDYAKVVQPKEYNINVYSYENNSCTEQLYKLSLISGQYSRYNLDKKFPEGSYEALYRRWIEQSVCKNLADDVLVYTANSIECGMVTYRINKEENTARIGLVAVDNNCQGKGVGSGLIQSLESLLDNQKVTKLFVATQENNFGACKWYENNGFSIDSKVEIYHWWMNENR